MKRFSVLLAIVATLALAGGAMAAPGGGGGGGVGNTLGAQCKNGGYLNVVGSAGQTFATQGACVSYVAHGGLLTAVPAFNVGYYVVNDGSTWCRSTTPIASTPVVGGGTATQSFSDGALNLAINNADGYADNGFYVPLGTLGSLAVSGYSITGTGSSFGTNLYLDTSADGLFFAWTGNCLSGLGGDAYGLGPSSTSGTLTVDGSTLFTGITGFGNATLDQLNGGIYSGISSSTNVAVWVGITAGSGGSLSTTITAAP